MTHRIRLQHINLMVRDLAAATEFYVDGLGLEPLPTPDLGFPAQFVRVNEDQEIHINELVDVTPERAHFCLRVSDFAATFQAMRERAAIDTATWGKARRLPSGVMQLFVRDPSGNLIELSCEADQEIDPAIFDPAVFEPSVFEPTDSEPAP